MIYKYINFIYRKKKYIIILKTLRYIYKYNNYNYKISNSKNKVIKIPIIEGWELSPDRDDMYQKIVSKYPVGDPLITSKCKLNNDNGLLVASENGFAWRLKMGMNTPMMSAGKSKWIRWHDLAEIIPKKPGQILVKIKVRKNGQLKLDGKGNAKIKKWKFTLARNKDEDKGHFTNRREKFLNLITEIYNSNKGQGDPPTSDSVM